MPLLPQENRTRTSIIFLLICSSVYTLLPFLLLSMYTHPAADDFSFAVRDKRLDYLTVLEQFYMTWTGRYFSTITLFRINPMIYDSVVAYKGYVLVLLLLFSAAVYYIVRVVSRQVFSINYSLALAAMLVVLYLLQLPSPSEGFYFFSTYATYQLPNILLIGMLGLLLKFFRTQQVAARKLYTGLIAILIVAIVGSNEMALVITCTTIGFVTIINLKNTELRPYLLVLFIVCVSSCLVAVLAPGNFNRMHEHPNGGKLIWSVVYGGFMTVLTFYRWLLPVLAASIIYLLYFGLPLAHNYKHSRVFAANLWLTIVFYLATIFLMNFAFAWSTGERPTPRLENVIYFFFLFGWFYVLQTGIQKYSSRLTSLRHTSPVIPTIALLMFLLSVVSIDSNISTAYVDLLSGKAKAYDKALTQRYSLLQDADCRVCDVPPLPAIPKTIFFHDIIARSDRQNPGIDMEWINRGLAAYFQKDSVFLSVPNPPVQDNLSTLRTAGKSSLHLSPAN
ncbi:hypothetical protein H7F15_14305 [Pontibacter sp. Tf4]|uniref:DUF6056 family protein n=1 Tax=Pontibacter sp. Tf4 TaxID=2761620 RepID=UPI00162656F9|nr:DUF6056 family protein [Pontibacter sp. Tf4]MBB6612219.1 hypothetical protein [Pontibacter sp. Tf4]